MSIKAVIFDSDGTLFNSGELIIAAYFHVADTHNLPRPSVAAIRSRLAVAMPLEQIFSELFPGENSQLLLATNAQYISNNLVRMTAYDGVEDLLSELHQQGYKLALFTGGTAVIIDVYKHHKLDHLFSTFVHSERITRHKPHPEGIMLAAKECEVPVSETIMVGDSRSDVIAGKSAGCAATIGVTHGNDSREALQLAEADYIIDSLMDLPQILASIK